MALSEHGETIHSPKFDGWSSFGDGSKAQNLLFWSKEDVKLPTIWTDGKAEVGRVSEEKRKKQEEQRRERVRRKKMQVREKVGKSRITVAPEGRKVGSLKRRVRSHLARWEMKNCTLLWCEAHFEVKSVKSCRSRGTFWSWDVEKVHAVYGAKHISKSNYTKHGTASFFMLSTWKLRKSRRISSLLTLDVATFQNLRESPRIALFSTLQKDR